jgi:hypothetical protein
LPVGICSRKAVTLARLAAVFVSGHRVRSARQVIPHTGTEPIFRVLHEVVGHIIKCTEPKFELCTYVL